MTDFEPSGRQRRGPFRSVRQAFAGPGGKLLAIAPAVLALVIGVAVGHATGSKTVSQPTRPVAAHSAPATTTAPTPTADVSSPAPEDTTPGDDSSAGASDGTDVPGATVGPGGIGTVNLTDLTPVSGAFQSSDTSPVINGKPQLFFIAQDLEVNNVTGDAGYDLGRHYTRLAGLLGIDDNSANSKQDPMVEIDGDGLKLATFTPTLGHPVKIDLNVSGVLRLDIKWSDPAATNFGTPAATLVLGNGQLTTVRGYHPSPSASPTD